MVSKAQDDDLVMNLVEMALTRAPGERRSYVASACAGDSELLDAVWNYVSSEQKMSGFLLEPLYPPLDPDHPFSPGDVLEGRFRIVREVAQGGMGIVYEAVDERLERRIALKCAKAGFRKRLPPEVRNASDISHPNVCKIFEIHTAVTEQGDVDFLTMEFLDGETLAERLRRGPLAEAQARTIALQLCAGLAEAHRREVIHGDLKSSNVILTPEPDGTVRAVITDFGLARKPQVAQTTAPASQLGGTPDYMAPELWRGAKPSTASDIYALGVILGELARGNSLTAKWHKVIERCLETQPAKRYASAILIAQAITPRTRRWFVGAAAAAVLAIATGVATYETATGPQQTVRLAALPFESSADADPFAARLFADVRQHISRLKGDQRTRLVVISPDAASLRRLDTPARARMLLGATHVLRGSIRNEDGRLVIRARLTDTGSLVDIKQWNVAYAPEQCKYAPVALAGMVTGALHVPPEPQFATISATAKQDYLSGLQHTRRDSEVDIALPLFERAVTADPDSALTHAGLAEGQYWKYYVTLDRAWLQRATESLNTAEQRNPDVAHVRRVAGLLKAAAGRYEQAQADYLRAIELEPGNSDAYRSLGTAYQGMNEHDRALAMYRRAVEIEPGYYRNHRALGAYYTQHADYAEALKSLQRTVDLEPHEPATHYLLGRAHFSLGQFDDSERELRLSLVLGETPDALDVLGSLLMYRGRDQEAVLYLKRALVRFPENYHWWMNLGTAYRHLQVRTEWEQAYRHSRQLAEAEMASNPRDGYVRACVAYVSAWLGDRSRAESEVKQAMHLSPNDTNTQRMAVETYEALKRREDSLAVLNASPAEVRIDLSRWPDVADLHRDPRFIRMLASNQAR